MDSGWIATRQARLPSALNPSNSIPFGRNSDSCIAAAGAKGPTITDFMSDRLGAMSRHGTCKLLPMLDTNAGSTGDLDKIAKAASRIACPSLIGRNMLWAHLFRVVPHPAGA